MTWDPRAGATPPAVPQRPTSTYPSADYTSAAASSDRPNHFNATANGHLYNFQPMSHASPPATNPQPILWNPNQQLATPIPISQSCRSAPTAAAAPQLSITTDYHQLPHTLPAPQLPPYSASLASTPKPNPYLSAPMPHNSSTSVVSSSSASTGVTAPPSTVRLPTIDSLRDSGSSLEYKTDYDQLLWAQDVLRLLERHVNPAGLTGLTPTESFSTSHLRLPPGMTELINRAVPIIISYTSHSSQHIVALASYLRGTLLSPGSCDDFLPKDPRQAFKDFETAARGGEPRGWYRLGRDYETVGDPSRAKDCYLRGQTKGDCHSTYRLGMAHLLGQLGFPSDPYAAIPLLRQAYDKADIDCPQPAYIFGMLLAGELDIPIPIPPELVLPANTHETLALSQQQVQAREALERAAYLCMPQAQYKCGWMYEHATYGCAYDPLMSVQWYSLASQGGEIEADMALSKWFLCGAEGHFVKNEKLARTFAEKAARKGHQNGSFAMGYYYELGIGGRKDTDQARKWYEKASRLGNTEAADRLRALAQPNPLYLSVQEHETRLNDTLVRRRTQAAMRSDERGDRQARRKRDHAERDRERMLVEADRAARAHQAEFGAMSPNPADIHSPRVGAGSGHTQVVYPTRPPSGYQSFAIDTRGRESPIRNPPGAWPEAKRYSLSDTSTAERSSSPTRSAPHHGQQSPVKKGPQTFAEMGFQSKPVEDEGCAIM